MKGVAITILMIASASAALLEKADEERQFKIVSGDLSRASRSGFISILVLGASLGGAIQNMKDEILVNIIYRDIIYDMLEAMINTDPEECFERWICDVVTHEETYWDMHPFLKFASDDEDIFVPKRFREYSKQLKSARIVGENTDNHQVCEETFQ